ncbi:universal stress protein [Quadrisphaera sp. GCM10027208]|uniref:universal stress protein n=1 Tax=Quadrisphaera sp. GCM10027208 TaxID=3273423 RepID=UPI0036111E3A
MPERRMAPVGVVAGFDGSVAAERAVARAAEEALRRRTRLAVVSVLPAATTEAAVLEGMLRDLVAQVRRRRPELVVTAHRVRGDPTVSPAGALCELAERAVLLVVAARGRGRQTAPGILGSTSPQGLGTVSRALLGRAACPVLLVGTRQLPVPAQRRALVVAAVDDGAAGAAVLRAALDESYRRGARVRLLHAYDGTRGDGPARARGLVRETTRAAGADAVGLATVVTPEGPAVALGRHAGDADLLVVAGGSAPRRPVVRSWATLAGSAVGGLPCDVLVVTPAAAVRLLPVQREQRSVSLLPARTPVPRASVG